MPEGLLDHSIVIIETKTILKSLMSIIILIATAL